MLHAHYSNAADALPTLTLAQLSTEPLALSAAGAGPWAESTAVATPTGNTVSVAGTTTASTTETLYSADTVAIALAFIGVWLMVMGGALIARHRVSM